MTAPRIARIDVSASHLEIHWQGAAEPAHYPFFWLRDHCHGPHSMNAITRQREVDSFAIPAGITAAAASLSDDGENVRVAWKEEQEESVFPVTFLWRMRQPGAAETASKRRLWPSDDITDRLERVHHDDVMAADGIGLHRWLEAVDRDGLALVEAVPATAEATEALLRHVAYIRETIFGGFWDFTANAAFADSAYSTVEIGPHTDGTYSIDSPGYQSFHCLEFDATGADSIFVDGFFVARELGRRDPEAFELLTRTPIPARYIGDGAWLEAAHPLIALERDGSLRQVAYNNYDRAPFRLPDADQSLFYRGLTLFNDLINDPANQLRFSLRPGTLVMFDNWRVLHARAAYEGRRRLCGAYHNREDVQSRLRLLRNSG